MCHQPPVTDVDFTFKSSLMRGRFSVVGTRFAAAVRSFRPGKRFLMVLARVLALFRSFDWENNFAMAPLPPTL